MNVLNKITSGMILFLAVLTIIAPLTYGMVAKEALAAPGPATASITTSRDTLYYDMNFTATITVAELNATAGEQVDLYVIVNGTENLVDTIADNGTFLYIFGVDVNGYVIVYNDTAYYTAGSTLDGQLGEGTNLTIKAVLSGTSEVLAEVVLPFQHQAPSFYVYGREYDEKIWIPRVDCDGTLNRTTNPAEWRIIAPDLNKDPFTYDTFNATIEIRDVSIAQTWTVTVLFNETGPNSGEFKATETVINSTIACAIHRWLINGTDFDNPVITRDVVYVDVYVPKPADDLESAGSKQLVIYVSVAKIEYNVISPARPLTITIYDADENLDTFANDTIQVTLINDALAGNVPVTLVEVDKTAGVFQAQVDLLAYYGIIFDEYHDTFILNYTDIQVNSCDDCTQIYCYQQIPVQIPFHNMTINITEAQVILRTPIACCPPSMIHLVLVDKDLDRTDKTDVYGVHLPLGTTVEDIAIYYEGTDVPAFYISMYAVLKNSTHKILRPLVTTTDTSLTFVEVGENTWEATIELQEYNWIDISNEYRDMNITGILVVVVDNFAYNTTADAPQPIPLQDCAKVQTVAIELDRYTVPVTKLMLYDFDTYEFEEGITIHVTVYDEGANVNCCQVDEIDPNWISLRLVKKIGDEVVLDTDSQPGLLTLDMVDDLGNLVDTCTIQVNGPLVETGPNTGVFTGTVFISSTCASPWLSGAELYVEYKSPVTGRSVKVVTFKVYDSSLTVEAEDGGKEVQFGDMIIVKVVEPDGVLDLERNKTLTVQIAQVCPATNLIIGTPVNITLASIAKGSDTFMAKLIIGEYLLQVWPVEEPIELGNPLTGCQVLNFVYKDLTPVDTNYIRAAEQKLLQEYREAGDRPISDHLLAWDPEVTKLYQDQISIVVRPGTLVLESYLYNDTGTDIGAMPSIDEMITIKVYDRDQNKYPDDIDTIEGNRILIEIDNTGVQYSLTQIDPAAELFETDISTGEFTYELSLYDLAAFLASKGIIASDDPRELIGHTIHIYYYDNQASCGGGGCPPTTSEKIEASFHVVGETGTLTVVDLVTGQEKPFYRCLCPSTVTTYDTLVVSVTDLDLYDMAMAGEPLPITVIVTKPDGTKITSTIELPLYRWIPNGYHGEKPVYQASIPIVCDSAFLNLLPPDVVASGLYVVASNGDIVTFIYTDQYNETGGSVELSKTISVGQPITGALFPVNVTTVSFSKIVGTTVVPVEQPVAGEQTIVGVQVTYNEFALRQALGATVTEEVPFYAVVIIKDQNGTYSYVAYDVRLVGSLAFTVSWTPPAAGTYTVQVVIVSDIETFTLLSQAYEFTVEVVSG